MLKLQFSLILILLISFGLKAQFNENTPWIRQDEYNKNTEQKNSIRQIRQSFENYFQNRDRDTKGSGYKPFKRWENHWKYYTDDNGIILPPELLWKAWEEKSKLARKKAVLQSDWQSVGPYTTNVKTGQGRVNTFIIDPNNPNTFYVGAPSGGLWKSTDKGINWVPLTDKIPQIGVSGIAIDPNNSNVIYITTGDDDARDTYSVGVMKSIDGGNNWNKTGLTFTTTSSSANEIYISPANSNIIWVATNSGFFKSKDAGKNWERKLSGNIRDMKVKPGDPNTIYAVTSTEFWKSTDGGDSFSKIVDGLPDKAVPSRLDIDVTNANAEVVYVLIADDDNSFEGVYKSVDSGSTFTKTQEEDDIFGGSKQAWYDMAITISPDDENTVFVGVLDIWKSTDGGNNFSQINRWWNPTEPAYTHADIHFMRYFNNKLYAGTDGGIYESDDDGSIFKDLTENLSISQYYKISTAKYSAEKIAGGLQDNGGFAYSNNQWYRYHGGDGMDNAIDPNNNNIFYGFTQNGSSLNVTYNAGVSGGGTLASAPDDEVNGSSDKGGNWVTPLAINNIGELFAGYSKLYRLSNGTWEAVSDKVFGGDLDNIDISPSDNKLIYVSRGNELYKSTDGGVSFTKNDFAFNTSISSIEINNNDNSTVYVLTSGYGSGRIYKSTDGGDSWTNIKNNMPSEPMFVIKHQKHSLVNDLFVGTSLGVYHTNDNMGEWEVFSTNLPNVPVKDLEINTEEKKITAGTYGRGVWQSSIKVTKANNDISLTSIVNNNSITCSGITPKIIVLNNGLNTIKNIDISYQVDGQPYNTTYSTSIGSGKEIEIKLPAVEGLSIGDHELFVETTIDGDTFSDNNSSVAGFTVNNSSEAKYINTFGDENADDWIVKTVGNSNQLWQRGVATTTEFTNLTNNSFTTNLTGNYTDETTSYLISPCYNLKKMENPGLRFDMAFDIELEWDVLYVEYTTDEGLNWNILGTASDPNWYNSDYINDDRPITVGKQWTGTQTTLKEYKYNLSELTDESSVIFRFVFASDQAENGEGAIIDNFTITATAVLAVNDFEKSAFTVYPNPSNDVFYIRREGTEEMNLSVYDYTGKLVYRKNQITENHYPLHLNSLENGIYFLKITQGNRQTAKRLILK